MAKTETSFTRMDESTAEQWAVIGAETFKNQPRVADAFLSMLRQLEGITDGFATNQLVHVCQTATLAEKFADQWDQIAFDPEYDTLPLEHFEPIVRQVFGKPTSL